MLLLTAWELCLAFCSIFALRAAKHGGAVWGLLAVVAFVFVFVPEAWQGAQAIASAVAQASRGVHGALTGGKPPPQWLGVVVLGGVLSFAPKAKPRPPRDPGAESGEARPR